MKTEDTFLIVPASRENQLKRFKEGHNVINVVKLKDGRIAINARAREHFSTKFPLTDDKVRQAKIPIEIRQLDYSEIWHDPDLPNNI